MLALVTFILVATVLTVGITHIMWWGNDYREQKLKELLGDDDNAD